MVVVVDDWWWARWKVVEVRGKMKGQGSWVGIVEGYSCRSSWWMVVIVDDQAHVWWKSRTKAMMYRWRWLWMADWRQSWRMMNHDRQWPWWMLMIVDVQMERPGSKYLSPWIVVTVNCPTVNVVSRNKLACPWIRGRKGYYCRFAHSGHQGVPGNHRRFNVTLEDRRDVASGEWSIAGRPLMDGGHGRWW